MKLKLIFCTTATLCFLSACKKDETKKTDSTIQKTDTLKVSNFIDSFKQNKDEKAFLTSLFKKIGKEPKNEEGSYKLIKIEDIKLDGFDTPVTLVYVDEIGGAMAGWPFKELFIINKDGKILGNYLTKKYQPVPVFENKSPLLMITEETSKGNGIHHFIGIEKGTIKEHLNTHGWNLQTIYGGYTPKELLFTLKDINNDDQKDIIFTGKNKDKPVYLSFIWDAKKRDFEPKDSLGIAP